MKIITFTKDKSSIKYYILVLICVLSVYLSKISELFIPLFDNVYYGNLVEMFINISNGLIWLIEFLAIFFVCKKYGIKIFTEPERKKFHLQDSSFCSWQQSFQWLLLVHIWALLWKLFSTLVEKLQSLAFWQIFAIGLLGHQDFCW